LTDQKRKETVLSEGAKKNGKSPSRGVNHLGGLVSKSLGIVPMAKSKAANRRGGHNRKDRMGGFRCAVRKRHITGAGVVNGGPLSALPKGMDRRSQSKGIGCRRLNTASKLRVGKIWWGGVRPSQTTGLLHSQQGKTCSINQEKSPD